MLSSPQKKKQPSKARWKYVGAQPLRFLIYVEMPNKHRAPLFAALAETLLKGGHDVRIVLEESISYRFGNSPEIHTDDNGRFIQMFFSGALANKTRVINTVTGETESTLAEANIVRGQKLRQEVDEFSPDHAIIWSGNFNYQEGTRQALESLLDQAKVIFAEVAWFTQKEFLYFDTKGVNAFSSIPNSQPLPLFDQQKNKLSAWLDRYRVKYLGEKPVECDPKKIFVPLQVDTDTSILKSSPFSTMREFIEFLEHWVPQDYEVVIKLHPKAKYPYLPMSGRANFKVVASGTIHSHMAEASTVIGINSTVLLEAAALGKKVIAFGEGLFSGSGALIEASPDSNADEMLNQKMDTDKLHRFLYELIYQRQVSIASLQQHDYVHLLSRLPFRDMVNPAGKEDELFTLDAQECKTMIKIGKSKVARSASLDVEKGGKISVGDECEIRHHAVLEVTGRYNGSIEIGDHCVIGIGNWLQGSGEINIGNDVIIGPYVAIVSTNHTYEDVEKPVARQPLQTGKVVIEDDVWIGAHCTITQNVTIGAHSIIGANSFVNSDVPPYSIVAGSPAKVIKQRN